MSRAATHGVIGGLVLLALLAAAGVFLVWRPAAAPPAAASPGEQALRQAVRELLAAPGPVELGPDEGSLRLAARVRALWPPRLREVSATDAELAPFAEPAPACWARHDPRRGDVVLLAPAGLNGTPLALRERLLDEAWTIARAAAREDDGARALGVALRGPLTFTGLALGSVDQERPTKHEVALAIVAEGLYPLLGP